MNRIARYNPINPPVYLSESEKIINEENPKQLDEFQLKRTKENNFNQQIQNVIELIESKMFEEAAELLIQLKQQYPDYDFSEIDKRIRILSFCQIHTFVQVRNIIAITVEYFRINSRIE